MLAHFAIKNMSKNKIKILYKTRTDKVILFFKIFLWYFKLGVKILYTRFFYNVVAVKPYKLTLEITSDCNFKCETCGLWNSKDKKYLRKEDLIKIFSEYSSDIFFLVISGGEVFLGVESLKEAIDIAMRSCKNLYCISINTNGYFTDDIILTVKSLLEKYSFLKIYIGNSYIPNQAWGIKKTAVADSFQKSENTYRSLWEMKNTYRTRLNVRKMITINTLLDYESIRNYSGKDDLWINFSHKSDLYNNNDFVNVGNLSLADKLFIVNDFYNKNRKHLSLFNRRYLYVMKKILSTGKNNRRCFSGINRVFINYENNKFICCMGLRDRSEIKFSQNCKMCWTPCEAVFDLVQNLSLWPN